MTLPPPRKLSRYVEPKVDDARVNRMWRNVMARRPFHTPAWLLPSLGVAAVAGVLAIGIAGMRGKDGPRPLAGTLIAVNETETVTVYDGIQLRLRPSARLRWDRTEPDQIEATLERGEVDLDVPHTRERVFTVHAGDFDVKDRGTRFMVAVVEGRVSVSVTSGAVEIQRRGAAEASRTLHAGESWASALPESAASSEPREASSAPLAVPASAAPAVSAPATSVGALVNPPPGAKLEPSARELLETANAARLAGRPHDAAAAFDALRRRYRTDARAGLAAFELGRLRLDAFGDPKLAAEAFDDAIALAPDAPFREDAEARLIEALDGMHSPRCVTEKAAYFARHASGLHAASVGARCLR